MLGYGHDESAPTPGGMFATNFVGERWYFTECLLVSCGVFCVYFVGVRHIFAIRQQRNGNPFAAVGDRFIAPAYPYSPTKRVAEMCVRWCECTYSVK